eukprot:5271157-Amphidinium_carterae.1
MHRLSWRRTSSPCPSIEALLFNAMFLEFQKPVPLPPLLVSGTVLSCTGADLYHFATFEDAADVRLGAGQSGDGKPHLCTFWAAC